MSYLDLHVEWPASPANGGPTCAARITNRTAQLPGANHHQGHDAEVMAGSLSKPEPVS